MAQGARSPKERIGGAKYFNDPVPDAEQNSWLDGNLDEDQELL